MTATLCVLPHDEPRRASEGFLCGGHYRRLDEDLALLPGLVDDLLLAHTSSRRASESKRPKPGSKVPYQDRAGDARDAIAGTLRSWASLVAEERDVAMALAPHAAPRYLRRHLLWISEQPWVDEFATEIRELVRQAWPVAYPEPPVLLREACPVVLTCDVVTRVGSECGGNLQVWMAREVASCRDCESSWHGKVELDNLTNDVKIWTSDVVTANQASARLADYGMQVGAGTIDKWFRRGYVLSGSTDDRGRRLYDWPSVRRHAGGKVAT